MKKTLLITLFLFKFTLLQTHADSQVVYDTVKSRPTPIDDSHVVYDVSIMFDENSGESRYFGRQIRESLEENCKELMEDVKRVELKDIQVGERKDGGEIFNFILEVSYTKFTFLENSDVFVKSLVRENIQLFFAPEKNNMIKPTLDKLQVVDISSSGVCK